MPLLAIALLIANDHLLKQAFASSLTGKLSDLAGLAFFPLFLQAGLELSASAAGRRGPPSRTVLLLTAAGTALVFALVKTTEVGGAAFQWGLALLQWPLYLLLALVRGSALPHLTAVALVQDPTDLLCLPAIALGVGAGWARTGAADRSRGPGGS